MFIDDVAKAIENEYNKLNLKVIKIPWVEELQVTFKPELFKELAEVIVV
jgi:hypothetical protein